MTPINKNARHNWNSITRREHAKWAHTAIEWKRTEQIIIGVRARAFRWNRWLRRRHHIMAATHGIDYARNATHGIRRGSETSEVAAQWKRNEYERAVRVAFLYAADDRCTSGDEWDGKTNNRNGQIGTEHRRTLNIPNARTPIDRYKWRPQHIPLPSNGIYNFHFGSRFNFSNYPRICTKTCEILSLHRLKWNTALRRRPRAPKKPVYLCATEKIRFGFVCNGTYLKLIFLRKPRAFGLAGWFVAKLCETVKKRFFIINWICAQIYNC